MISAKRNTIERFPSPANLPPDKAPLGQFGFLLRRLLDMQVSSVLEHLLPWLSKRCGHLLEVGCGAQPYRDFVASGVTYQGLDWVGAGENFGYSAPDTVYYEGGRFPFEDASFDAVFHTEVIEHVYDLRTFLAECRRVLVTEGELFFTIPFQARYHYIPHDYWRLTPAAIERLLLEAGFERITIRSRGTDISVAAYKILSLTFRWLGGGLIQKILGILMLPCACIGLLAGHASLAWKLGSEDDCLGYAVTASAP
ncbi:MAG: putative S-adenosylmethionine-dependent methyltransferase [Candidatus Omnitrophica bacterium ADurb.Bin292]|jgi:SAM-dependent methyltransferase|nr:MAG: putative S-adenosylmethionine-dependent methyltransferase [Candidatus Omnitrophica bacterium ADurb.Bin292]